MNSVIKYLKFSICFLLNSLFKCIPHRTHKKYDVVIVRADLLGDLIIWTDCLRAYREKYKGKKVLYICSSQTKRIAEELNYFTDVIGFDPINAITKISYHVKLIKQMRNIEADIVISPMKRRQFASDFICNVIKANKKVAITSNRFITVKNFIDYLMSKLLNIGVGNITDLYYDSIIKIPNIDRINEFEANEMITRRIVDDNYRYRLSDLDPLIVRSSMSVSKHYCFISLSSSTVLKDWPIEKLAELVKYIPVKYKLLLSGYGEKDLKRAEYLIKYDNGQHLYLNYVNKTTITDMIKLISEADFLIGNDSSGVHIAAACRVPSLCFLHGALFDFFVPYPDSVPEKEYHPHCVYKRLPCYDCKYNCTNNFDKNSPFYCLREVTVDMARIELEKIIKFLNNKKNVENI